MKTKLFKSTWNTYRITGYTHQVGSDPRATGGVHLHQVRRLAFGWQNRIVDSNGRYQSAGPVGSVSRERGEALFEMAKQR